MSFNGKAFVPLVSLGLLFTGASPAFAAIEVHKATEIQPYTASELQPYHSTEVPLYQSTEIPVHKAQEVKPTQPPSSQKGQAKKVDPSSCYGTFNLYVPGAVSTTDDYVNHTRTTTISPGSGKLKSWLTINANGTYVWNSSWDKKVIKGKWKKGDADYPVILLNAQEHKNWKIGIDKRKNQVYVWDGYTYYIGIPKK
ncbi:hypothetical protein PP175_23780 [Aneurinibacillus sp. Ricciae_BoGa-3]|uniref:hypothetical protein n=1 Tax=Aneurinibacillus sp. Ricciae_BoGa-3 TaxID=3022697 RepID=UPI00233FAE1D|nr:hypothetical protein [Aneurinibacillus sp. Ricciae_BoGa-3]WCK54272.1 hypothetical protein PP175_23780 [Aneurinibacillus sp. Ricciae_BoGa-3]